MDKTAIGQISVHSKLYKYRTFDLYTLRMLTNSQVYFSAPDLFNDPLDCKPELYIDNDLDLNSLESLLTRMTPESSQLLNECRRAADYYCSPEEQANYYFSAVKFRIKDALYKHFGNHGILSFAERWNSPLMWSHYGDQHKGICLGFDTSSLTNVTIRNISYGGERNIKCSDLVSYFIDGCTAAMERMKETFFFTKANDWKYEGEWRAINGQIGETASPFELRDVYFGMKCDDAVKTAILSLKHSPELKYHQIFPEGNTFELSSALLTEENKQWYRPRPSAWVAFSQLSGQ